MDEFDLGSVDGDNEIEDLENGNEIKDLGNGIKGSVFDPFASDAASDETVASEQSPALAKSAGKTKASSKPESEHSEFADKLPVFEYAGATENIDDTAKTFEELRIEKALDFPELEDGKRVSWMVEYGKITKTVADPEGTSVGKMKSDIESSKEFEDSLKKRGADKNPTCKIKPRITAQSKGLASSYCGVFTRLDEAEASGKVISIIPGRDGRVYEIRNNEMGKFITPVTGCNLLSDVKAGFVPAPGIPRIPMDLMTRIVTFFRSYMYNGNENEVLVNLYWDKESKQFIADVPEQTVSKTSIESTENLDFAHDRYIHYMDIHSHNSMKAFFSPIDDADEKATRLYTVIGHLDQYFPEIKTRISNGGRFLEINPSQVFENIALAFPERWKDTVHFKAPDSKDIEAKQITDGDA